MVSLTFAAEDLAGMTPDTPIKELLAKSGLALLGAEPESAIDYAPDWNWHNRVDLTPEIIDEFMEGCAEETIEGLRVLAEQGPMIHATALKAAGIENYGHFQGRTTKRTRTVTKNPKAFLLGFDEWNSPTNNGVGHYAVTDTTWKTLKQYFAKRKNPVS